MNPKHEFIDTVFGPIFSYLESIYITKWTVGILFNGLMAYLIFKSRKNDGKIKAREVIIVLTLLLGLGYAIYDQISILQALFKK